MPKSEAPRSKASTRREQNALQDMIQRASALDRRRQAQIANQVASIDRLLVDGSYGPEMKILHEGAAALKAENDELRELLAHLVRAVEAEGPRQLGAELAVTLPIARAAAGLSAPVSESDGEAG